jgi:hypothetical protein
MAESSVAADPMPRRTHALLVCSNVLRHGAHECVRTRRAVAASHGYRAFADDVYVYSIPDNSHDMQPGDAPAWAQGDAPPVYEESVVELPVQVEPAYVAGYDVYVIGQDQEPATPSPTGQAIGDGLFNRAGPKDFGS